MYRGLTARALKSREARMVTRAMGAAMMGPMYSFLKNGAKHGFRGFHLRLSTLQGSNNSVSSSCFSPLVLRSKCLHRFIDILLRQNRLALTKSSVLYGSIRL